VASTTGVTTRLHVLGAAGSGTTTLGLALAERLGSQHLDAMMRHLGRR
jgi:adenylate kinase family enzyme